MLQDWMSEYLMASWDGPDGKWCLTHAVPGEISYPEMSALCKALKRFFGPHRPSESIGRSTTLLDVVSTQKIETCM